MAIYEDSIGNAYSKHNNNNETFNTVDVDEKNAAKQRCQYGSFNLHNPFISSLLNQTVNEEDESDGEDVASYNKLDDSKNHNNQFQQSPKPFTNISRGKALIFIANALLILCITSVEPLNNLYHYTDYPQFYNLMKKQIRQIRYDQHNGNTNSNWTVEDNSRRATNNGSPRIFSEYIAEGEKVIRLRKHIKNILVPRVSGTKGNIDVRNYIIKQLDELGYSVSVDQFKDNTPLGEVAFGNIIADSNPRACKQLVLACHYDSKKIDGFLGATDSAVPCAILLEIARTIKDNNLVTPNDSKLTHGVRFVFFDGEEAFVEWTDTDSLYGSRHLASKWSKQAMPKECGNGSELKRISLFVLLDLIGARDTRIPRYFNSKSYYKLMTLERQYLAEFNESRRDLVFTGNYDFRNLGVQDDHVPFHSRQVPILLLLAGPFPSVWHTIDDNHDSIDYKKTVRTLAVVDRFTIDYLNEST